MKKTLTITFCGAPNVGKSTLLNRLLNCKLAICSPKPQTTRFNIKGILTKDETQLVLVDTPGIFKPRLSQLEKQIVKEAWRGLSGSDVICLICDATVGIDATFKNVLSKIKHTKATIIAVLNKIDLVSFDTKIKLLDDIYKTNCVKEVFPLSAKKNIGCDHFLEYFFSNAKDGDWQFSEDDITDKNSDFLASEFVREQLFNLLQQEIPYMLDCETEMFEIADGVAKISVLVLVGKENHKKIILGKNGCNLKKIIRNASINIENLLQIKVNLKIFIRTKR